MEEGGGVRGDVLYTWSGQPNMEKGRRPDENQVSSTSSSAKEINRTLEYQDSMDQDRTLFQDNLVFRDVEFLSGFLQSCILCCSTA